MYNKNDKIAEELINFSDKDVKLLSDEDIAAQYDNFECTSISVEPSRVHDNWYNFTLELEFPDADHPDFSDYVIENVYYDADADRWGFDNWYPEETSKQLKELMLKELEKEGYLKPDDEDYDLEAIGLVNGTTDIVVVKNNKTGLYQLNKFDKNESDRIGHMIATKTFETEAEAEEWYLSWSKSRGNNDIAESLINEDDATGHVDIKALDTNKFGEVENLEFELVHDGETYYVECYAPDLANEDYYVIRVYKTEGQQLNNETEVAKGYTDSTGGVFAGDELEFYDYEKDYSELTQKIMDVILANLKEVVSHEQLESKMNEISDKVVSDVTGRRASDYIWTKMHPDENSPEDTEKVRKKLARNLDLVNKRNARKDKERGMQSESFDDDKQYGISLPKVGNEIEINYYTDDPDLAEWLDENPKGAYKVTEVDTESELVWVEGCPYAIWMEDILNVYDNPIHIDNPIYKGNKENNMQNDGIAESLLNEGAGATVTFHFNPSDRDWNVSTDLTSEGTIIKVSDLLITDYYNSAHADDGGYITFDLGKVKEAVVHFYNEYDRLTDEPEIKLEDITEINEINPYEIPNLTYSWGWTRAELPQDTVLNWEKNNQTGYLPQVEVIFTVNGEQLRSIVEVDGEYHISEDAYYAYRDLDEYEDEYEESYKGVQVLNTKVNNTSNNAIAESLLKGEELSEAKIVEEDLNDLLSMSGERYTNIADLDMPAPLADSVPTTEDGEPITIELLYKAITDLTATIGNLATSIKQPKVELKPLENPMGQPAPKAEPALTDDLIGELDDVADDVADDEQKIADDEKDIKDKESEIEDDAEDLDELDKEIEADLDNTEKTDKKKKDKKSDKDEDDKKKKNEDLETAKKEIDKAIADKKSPEEIDATIDYTTDNDTDEKAANEYKVQKMKEACKASVTNSLLNKLKWGN